MNEPDYNSEEFDNAISDLCRSVEHDMRGEKIDRKRRRELSRIGKELDLRADTDLGWLARLVERKPELAERYEKLVGMMLLVQAMNTRAAFALGRVAVLEGKSPRRVIADLISNAADAIENEGR